MKNNVGMDGESKICAEDILVAKPESNVVIPTSLPRYEENSDPYEYRAKFEHTIGIYRHSEKIMAKAFVTTLYGVALDWYLELSEG